MIFVVFILKKLKVKLNLMKKLKINMKQLKVN